MDVENKTMFARGEGEEVKGNTSHRLPVIR